MAITKHELKAAETRMTSLREAGYAVSARYDRRRSRVVVTLNTGVELAFPTRLARISDQNRNQPGWLWSSLASAGYRSLCASAAARRLRIKELDGAPAWRRRRPVAHRRQDRRLARKWPQGRQAA